MNQLVSITEGIELLLLVFGSSVAAIFIIWAGIQLMAAQGDPQAMARCRNSFFGIIIGMIIMGLGPSIPGIISNMILEPAGAAPISAGQLSNTCSDRLRQSMISNPQYREQEHFQYLVDIVKAVHSEECAATLWTDHVVDSGIAGTGTGSCEPGTNKVGGIVAPSTLLTSSGLEPDSQRDAAGNILVYIARTATPAPPDVTECWLYVQGLGQWFIDYR